MRAQHLSDHERHLLTLEKMWEMYPDYPIVRKIAKRTGYSRVRQQKIMYEMMSVNLVDRILAGYEANGMPRYHYRMTDSGYDFFTQYFMVGK